MKRILLTQGKAWQVRIGVNRKRLNLGRYSDKIKAACVYNKAARKFFGPFAYQNLV